MAFKKSRVVLVFYKRLRLRSSNILYVVVSHGKSGRAQLFRHCRFKPSREQSFVFESEIIIEAARHGFLCAFVPVQTTYPENARLSHFRPVKDIARITRMVAWRLFIRGFFCLAYGEA
nr:hypothetical protein [Methylomarinum sp. Ch1-1]MDP4519814.1 hypothetical protein [Methylomarinum sp. Ch1-1]